MMTDSGSALYFVSRREEKDAGMTACSMCSNNKEKQSEASKVE
jgi:hypothetical protein